MLQQFLSFIEVVSFIFWGSFFSHWQIKCQRIRNYWKQDKITEIKIKARTRNGKKVQKDVWRASQEIPIIIKSFSACHQLEIKIIRFAKYLKYSTERGAYQIIGS